MGGGRAGGVGPPGPSVNCFPDTLSSGPHTRTPAGCVARSPDLKGLRRVFGRGVQPQPISFPGPQLPHRGRGPSSLCKGWGRPWRTTTGRPGASPTCSRPLPSAPLTSAHASLNLWPSSPCLPSCPSLRPPDHSSRDHLSAPLRVWG